MAEEQRHTLELIAHHLIAAARPLIEARRSLGAFMRLMARIGFFAGDIPPPYHQLATTVSDAAAALEGMPPTPSAEDLFAVLQKAKGVYDAIRQLAAGPAPSGADASAYAAEIGERLFELLLTDYLAAEQPGAYNVLAMLKVITTENVPATATRPSFVRTNFRWEELPKVITDPSELPARVYGWGHADLDDELLLTHLGELGLALGLPVAYRVSDETALVGYLGTAGLFPPPSGRSLVLPFFYANVEGRTIEGALALQRLPAQGSTPPGLILEPRLPSQMPLQIDLAPSAKLNLRAGTNLGQLFGVTITPPGDVSVRYPFAPGTPPPAAGVGASFSYTPEAPATLLGDPKGSRIELGSAAASLGVDMVGSNVDLNLSADLHGLKIVIAAADADSFLRSVIGDKPAAIDVPLGIDWSRQNGIRFKGSAAFEVSLHPHLQLGPLCVEEVTVSLTAPTSGAPRTRLKATAGISGELGPLAFLVQGIGIKTDIIFEPGNAGPFGIDLGFQPPDGIGLEVDAGGFTGGGFLIFDKDKGEYSGGLDLLFAGKIAVRCLGILDTKIPGGGFSLLILISSEFPPIQLPFGFKLLGVGGLLGLNRSVSLEALAIGLRDNSFDSILFPTNVVANAPQIIGDLNRLFPPNSGHFLVGPMAKLGWATPTLVHAEVGLVLDLPRLDIAFLGVIRAALPADEIPILTLQVNFFGTFDFKTGRLQLDASLYDSHILDFTLTGDMAFRFYWLKDANLLLTVGGFNPAYTPPPMNLPKLSRISIVLFEGNPDVRAEGYFAITANTTQFGARIELNYGVHGFSVYGFLSLDAVMTMIPFHFSSDTAAMLAVRSGNHTLFSIHLELTLDGPLPWHARGTASFEVGFVFTITISVHFDITVGPSLATLLEAIDVLAKLFAALADPRNWRTRLPTDSHQTVTLRTLPDPANMLVVQPFGFIDIAQKISPLAIAIQRFGSTTPQGGSVFRIVDVAVGGTSIDTAAVHEEFAPAQFFAMSDAEKLSRPSFAAYEAGIAIGGGALPIADFMRRRDVSYEVIYIPEHPPIRVKFGMPEILSQFSVAGAAVSRSPLSRATSAASPLADRVTVESDQYVVVSTEDLGLFRSDLVFDTATAADLALQGLFVQRPELTGTIQVVPATAVPRGGAPA
jgi:hypothetical protein